MSQKRYGLNFIGGTKHTLINVVHVDIINDYVLLYCLYCVSKMLLTGEK